MLNTGRLRALTLPSLMKGKFIKSFLGVGSTRLLSIPLTLAISIVLARQLGPDSFGYYTFIMTIVPLIGLPITGGIQNILLREVAKYSHLKEWSLYRGVLRTSHIFVFAFSGIILLLYFVSQEAFGLLSLTGKWELLSIGLFLLPVIGLNAVRNGAMKGLNRPFLAEAPTALLQPIVTLFLIFLTVTLFKIDSKIAIWLQVSSFTFSLILASIVFKAIQPKEAKLSALDYKIKPWFQSYIPFLLLALVGTLSTQLGIVTLGIFSTGAEVAALKVAERGAIFVVLPLTVINMIIGPYIVKSYQSNNLKELKKLAKMSARAAFALASPIALVLILFGESLIHLAFGEQYSSISYTPLIILCIAHLANAFFGSVGFLLTMTGHERSSVFGHVLAVLINLTLCYLLIPTYGAVGAALATAAGILVWNFVFFIMVIKRVKITSCAI